ncbi:hypothetical protein [Actinoplanes derwentensis]|uniref:F5/8 type C domain-containing protein n=1 Tax=Actinoplanes derwentensis TaxID=113562 RepID=A0A1H1TM83_9ACTN|nr:hypothetical protein [Actinoplanes derwentensis]GID85075.1 hypothetical protein Ade03nite_39990 [Actinoplanes derwentensis]SDS61350.1 hypothetical protein SAMN04489716_1182 [Actinoplanes derwentensis]
MIRLALLCALLCTPVPAEAVRLTVDPSSLMVITGRCNARDLAVRMTNTSEIPVYADAILSASPALHLQRQRITTWLPPGQTRTVPVRVSAPSSSSDIAGEVIVTSGTQRVTVAVTVTGPSSGADLTSRATRVTASSFRAAGPVCAGADGDPATWWIDGTNRVWPDHYEVAWATPFHPCRVVVGTLPATQGGLRDWDVQIWSDETWLTVDTVRENTATTRTSTLPPIPTTAVRIRTLAANGADDQSRITDLLVVDRPAPSVAPRLDG